jgi:hypothetical protein
MSGCVDVLTKEIELETVLLIGRMDRDLRGRKREDQPPTAGIHGVETQDILEESAVGLSIPAVDEDVRA